MIKVGGSLFDLPDLPQRLHAFLAAQSPAVNVLLAGGGPWCDLIRAADQRFELDEATADDLALRTMHITAGVLAAVIGCPEIAEFGEVKRMCQEATVDGPVVMNVARFVHREERELPGQSLPLGWHTTSDSIAARVACLLGASELVLLKSCVGEGSSLQQWAATGIVDREFPRAAAECQSVRLIDLRTWPATRS